MANLCGDFHCVSNRLSQVVQDGKDVLKGTPELGKVLYDQTKKKSTNVMSAQYKQDEAIYETETSKPTSYQTPILCTKHNIKIRHTQ